MNLGTFDPDKLTGNGVAIDESKIRKFTRLEKYGGRFLH